MSHPRMHGVVDVGMQATEVYSMQIKYCKDRTRTWPSVE